MPGFETGREAAAPALLRGTSLGATQAAEKRAVSSPDFFELMQHSKWKTADRGTVIVQAGTIFDKVIMVHNGSAEALGERRMVAWQPAATPSKCCIGIVVVLEKNAS